MKDYGAVTWKELLMMIAFFIGVNVLGGLAYDLFNPEPYTHEQMVKDKAQHAMMFRSGPGG